MEEEIQKRFDTQGDLLLEIRASVEKTRKLFMWTLIISLVMIVLPLIAIVVIVPMIISTYSSAFGGLL